VSGDPSRLGPFAHSAPSGQSQWSVCVQPVTHHTVPSLARSAVEPASVIGQYGQCMVSDRWIVVSGSDVAA